MLIPSDADRKDSLAYVQHRILRLGDDALCLLEVDGSDPTRISNKPDSTRVCSIAGHPFNPVAPEVAFDISCDDGMRYVVNRMAVYDYNTYELAILDPLLNMSQCSRRHIPPMGAKLPLCQWVNYISC
jgi:hypothetical protein